MHRFEDRFGVVAKEYSEARPSYPSELFVWLNTLCQEHQLAWDAGAGNGQASVDLAQYFDRVVATDASAKQLQAAHKKPNIVYRLGDEGHSGLGRDSVDLVTVAQALHWFDLAKFSGEVDRVLKKGGVVAAWTYGPLLVEDQNLNAVTQRFYHELVGSYWPSERAHVENGYRDLNLPFAPIDSPNFAMSVDWTPGQIGNYLRTWSASNAYTNATGIDPVGLWEASLPDGCSKTNAYKVIWPLTVKAYRK